MRKIFQLEDRFPTGEPTIQLVMTSNGRGGRLLEKRAFDSAASSPAYEYLKTISPKTGHSIVLVNALGAYETYDENRNGDSFPNHPVKPGVSVKCGHKECQAAAWITEDEALSKHYKTFELHGGIYKHHCFPAGTSIVRADRIRQAIEEIKIGDQVATHDGNFPVTQIFKQSYEGLGVTLRLRGQLEPLTATANHPLFILRRDQVHCRHGYNRLTPSPHITNCQEFRTPIGNPEWLPAEEVLPGDYLLLRSPQHGHESVEGAFAALVGWVASEGHLGKKGIIQFTFSETNSADIHAVKTCFAELNTHVTVTPRPQYGVIVLTACSKELHSRLSKYIQGVLGEKHLTSEILNWNTNALIRMLGAYIDGDGHIPTTGRNRGQLRIRSSSRSMLWILSDIIRSLEIPVTINWDKQPGFMVSPTNGQTYLTNGSGCVAVVPDYVPNLVNYSRKNTIHKVEGITRECIFDGYYLIQVTERDLIELHEDVFNLEIEGPHTFIAGEVVVHNCNKDPSKSLGKVLKAIWNEKMQRVELLLDIVNERDVDLTKKIADGEYPAVSMGTHVRHDVCSICGHRAPTRKDYCDHARNKMRQILSNGEKVCVHNPSCRFFDISFVYRPADPTGFMLKKVASDTALWIGHSAKAGELVDVYEQKIADEKKLSDIRKQLLGRIVASRQNKDVNQYKDTARVNAKNRKPATDQEIAKLSQYPISVILSTFAAKNAALSTSDVSRLFLKKAGMSSPDWLIDRIVAFQPIMDEVFARDPSLREKTSGLLDLDDRHIDPRLFPLVQDWVEKHAGLSDYLKREVFGRAGVVPNLPVGPGAVYRAAEPPRTDVLTLTDPNTGRIYQTNRGAAQQQHHQNILHKLFGTALLTAGYTHGLSLLPGVGNLWKKIPLAARVPLAVLPALGTYNLGQKLFNPLRNPSYITDQGIEVPGNTEFVKVSALTIPTYLDKLAFDVIERITDVNDPYSMLRIKISAQAPSSKIARFLAEPGDDAQKAAALCEDLESGTDSLQPPTIDLGALSDRVGELLLS